MRFQVSSLDQQQAYGALPKLNIDSEQAMEIGGQAVELIKGAIGGRKAKKEAERLAKLEQAELQKQQIMYQQTAADEERAMKKASILADRKRTNVLMIGGIGALTLLAGTAAYFLILKK